MKKFFTALPLILAIILTCMMLFIYLEPKNEVKITFQVWNNETKSYENVYVESVEIGSLTENIIPEVPERKYYMFEYTWTPPLEETVTKTTTYKANYVPITDTNKDNVADEEQVRIKFQVWDVKTKKYKNVYNKLVTKGTSIKSIVPKIPERKYYKVDQTWTPKLEKTAKTNKTYKANYKPINDVNKNNIADEEDKKYKVTYYKDVNCTELHLEVKDVLVGLEVPKAMAPTKQYYTFSNWSPSPEDMVVKKDLKFCATYKPINDVNKNNIADEEENKHKVTFYKDTKCTQVYKEFNNVVTGKPVPSVTEPTKQYYKFTGWTPSTNIQVTKDEKFCAKYKPINDANKNNIADEEDKKYKVTYYKDTNCTQVYKEFNNVLVGTIVPSVTAPTKKYYTFTGWSSQTNISVNKNEKFCAKYKPVNDLNKDGIADEEQSSLIPDNKYHLATKDFKNYTFVYNNVKYKAIYTTDNWKIIDSYKIRDKNVMTEICALLIEQHPVHGKDMKSYRTASDMAYEWEQHNLVYDMLPSDHSLKDNAKDVDLNPADQGKSAIEIALDRYL